MAWTQKKTMYAAIFVVGVALVFWWSCLNRATEGFEDPSRYQFIMYGVEWCPHCVEAKPEFESIGKTISTSGGEVRCEVVNPEKEPAKVLGKVDGFPTFHLYADGKLVKEYKGSRTKDGYLSFLQQNAV